MYSLVFIKFNYVAVYLHSGCNTILSRLITRVEDYICYWQLLIQLQIINNLEKKIKTKGLYCRLFILFRDKNACHE